MNALIRKDLYTQKASTYFLTALWFIIFTNFFTDGQPVRHILLLIFVAYFIAISTSNKDFEKESVLVNSLPVTRKQFVLAKYAAGFMWFGLSAVGILVYIFLFETFAPFPTRMMTMPELLIALGSFYVILSLFYPIQFKMGYLLATSLTIILPLFSMMSFRIILNIMENPRMVAEQQFFLQTAELVTTNQWTIALSVLLISAILTWLSILLSIRIVRKTDFDHA
ncbi:ABC-2 transporter permease [Sporosarcina sp.]|uniref:ABC-2 transporter permease n=1 Tax=Sporosarcina sp. TaxID=49982 RepID=UPI00260233B7|nr:ABC-2 transporter permease [Sporosarcina sp.]